MAITNSSLTSFLTAKEDIKVYFLGHKTEDKYILFGGYTFKDFTDFPFEFEENAIVLKGPKEGGCQVLGFRSSTSNEKEFLYECKSNTFFAGAYSRKEDILLEGIVPKGTEYFLDDDGKILCAKKYIVLKEV